MHTIPIKFFDAAAIICCKILRYLLIITITKKKEFRIKYCEPFEKKQLPQ